MLFEQKKIKLWNKWHFVEKKVEIMQHFLKMQYISLLLKYIKYICRDVFFIHVFMYVNIGCLKVKECMMLYICSTICLLGAVISLALGELYISSFYSIHEKIPGMAYIIYSMKRGKFSL